MFDNFFVQFILEILRALLVDELSGRVRRRVRRWFVARDSDGGRRAILSVHQRTRAKLLHKLRTALEDDL